MITKKQLKDKISKLVDDVGVPPYLYGNKQFIAGETTVLYNSMYWDGNEIKNAIIETAVKHKDDDSPIELVIWEGTMEGNRIRVQLWERDEGVKLLGPAALNKIWIREGSILGLPENKISAGDVKTNLSYLEGIASKFAYEIEVALDQNKKHIEEKVKMCYRASEVNIEIDDRILEYIHSKQNKIDIRGPVFIGLSFEILDQ